MHEGLPYLISKGYAEISVNCLFGVLTPMETSGWNPNLIWISVKQANGNVQISQLINWSVGRTLKYLTFYVYLFVFEVCVFYYKTSIASRKMLAMQYMSMQMFKVYDYTTLWESAVNRWAGSQGSRERSIQNCRTQRCLGHRSANIYFTFSTFSRLLSKATHNKYIWTPPLYSVCNYNFQRML